MSENDPSPPAPAAAKSTVPLGYATPERRNGVPTRELVFASLTVVAGVLLVATALGMLAQFRPFARETELFKAILIGGAAVVITGSAGVGIVRASWRILSGRSPDESSPSFTYRRERSLLGFSSIAVSLVGLAVGVCFFLIGAASAVFAIASRANFAELCGALLTTLVSGSAVFVSILVLRLRIR
jgi:hypothetical protein